MLLFSYGSRINFKSTPSALNEELLIKSGTGSSSFGEKWKNRQALLRKAQEPQNKKNKKKGKKKKEKKNSSTVIFSQWQEKERERDQPQCAIYGDLENWINTYLQRVLNGPLAQAWV